MLVWEAKEKVCPFMSGLGSGVAPSGDFLIDFEPVKCMAGDCMGWDYTEKSWFERKKDGTKNYNLDANEGYCKRLNP